MFAESGHCGQGFGMFRERSPLRPIHGGKINVPLTLVVQGISATRRKVAIVEQRSSDHFRSERSFPSAVPRNA